MSEVVIVSSVDRYYRSVVAAAAPSPSLRTVADRVNDAPAAGLLSFTEGEPTSRSGAVVAGGVGAGGSVGAGVGAVGEEAPPPHATAAIRHKQTTACFKTSSIDSLATKIAVGPVAKRGGSAFRGHASPS